MKKIKIILIILLTTAINCGFFDSEEWARYKEDRERRGHRCYENYYGNVICEDRYSD